MPLSVYGYSSRLTFRMDTPESYIQECILICMIHFSVKRRSWNSGNSQEKDVGSSCWTSWDSSQHISPACPDPSEWWQNHLVFQPLLPVLYQLQISVGCTVSYRLSANVLKHSWQQYETLRSSNVLPPTGPFGTNHNPPGFQLTSLCT